MLILQLSLVGVLICCLVINCRPLLRAEDFLFLSNLLPTAWPSSRVGNMMCMYSSTGRNSVILYETEGEKLEISTC